MPSYLAEAYTTKAVARLALATPPTAQSLEAQIQARLLAGNAAFFRQRYSEALSEYLAAWALLPVLVWPVFPVEVGKLRPEMLAEVELVKPLLEASVNIHRLRPSLGPAATIMPSVEPPQELRELTDRFAGDTTRAQREHALCLTLLRQGEFDLARRHAEEALAAGDDARRGDGFALLAAVALASQDVGGAQDALANAAESYRGQDRADALAAVEHNLGVASTLAGNAEAAAGHFANAIHRVPALGGWQVTQALNPGSASVTRAVGSAGLPLLLHSGAAWQAHSIDAAEPVSEFEVAGRNGAVHIDLAAGAGALEAAFYQPRIDAVRLADLIVDLGNLGAFTSHLAHVSGLVLPLSLGDTYHALGRHDLAASYYLRARDYAYLNFAIERPMLWARLARTYLAEGDRHYRQQDIDAAVQAYSRIVALTPAGFELSGALYEGSFAPYADDTLALLNAPDRLAFDGIDYGRRIVILQALANLGQIANGINYLGIPDDIIPIHPWRYLQNQARYFTNQAIQAERAYLNFKSTAEKEAFTRLTLQQAVDAQKSAVKVEDAKVALARTQQDVAQSAAEIAGKRIDQAIEARDDYATVAEQTAFYDEITALYSAPDGGVHVDPDFARQLGIQLTYVHETYTDLFGTSDFYYTRDVAKGDILRTMNRSRSKATRELELRNMDRKVDQLTDDLTLANGQVEVAKKGVKAAQAQQELAKLRAAQARSQLDAFNDQELSPELWDNLAQAQREISQRYLDWAIGAAFLMERAYEFEYDLTVNRIRFDYERSDLNGMLAADLLLADVDQFSYDRLLDTEKKAPIKVSIALADRYPFQFRRDFQQTGRLDFQTTLEDFDRWNPGTYRRKLRRVEVIVEGLVSADGLHGTLTNSGFSLDRRRDGTVQTRVQKAETMILSRFDMRGDGFVFTATDEQVLAVFENSGVAGGWVLELPPDVNDVDFRTITNIHLVLYYDACYSIGVANVVRAGLAAVSHDEQMLGLSLRFQYPDEFYNFQSEGALRFALDEAYLPFHHLAPRVRSLCLNVETVDGVSSAGLTLTVEHGANVANVTTTANGLAGPGDAALAVFMGGPLTGDWTVRIDRALNQAAFDAGFGWDKVRNLACFANYGYSPRGRPVTTLDLGTDPLAAFERIDDPAATDGGPGAWSYDAAAVPCLRQQSNLHAAALLDTSPAKPGAMLLARTDAGWPARRDLLLRVRLQSDSDGIGVILRYQDDDNFYYFLMDATLGYRRLGRKVGGVFAELDVPAFDATAGYQAGQAHELCVAVVGDALVAALDGVQILSGRDHALPAAGRFGLLAWKNPGARVLGLSVRDA